MERILDRNSLSEKMAPKRKRLGVEQTKEQKQKQRRNWIETKKERQRIKQRNDKYVKKEKNRTTQYRERKKEREREMANTERTDGERNGIEWMNRGIEIQNERQRERS